MRGYTSSSPDLTGLIQDPEEVLKNCRTIKNFFFPRGNPAAYVVLDLETTGLDIQNDWPIEVAALFVTQSPHQAPQVVHSFHSYLAWTKSGMVPEGEFRQRLMDCNLKMAERYPNVNRPTPDTLQALGKPPRDVMAQLASDVQGFFASHQATHQTAIAGHNVFFFDANMLHSTYARQGMVSPLSGSVLDTGLMVKAAQTKALLNSLQPGVMMIDWLREVRNFRSRAKWSLHDYCAKTFGLGRFLPDFVLNMPHSSLTDVWNVVAFMSLLDNNEDLPQPSAPMVSGSLHA